MIEYRKAFQGLSQLHLCKIAAIEDRDFRTSSEIEASRKKGISGLGVAEIENLFIVPEIKSDKEVENSVMSCLVPVAIKKLHEDIVVEYQTVLENRRYEDILKLLDMKSIANDVGKFLGLGANQYCEKLLRFLGDADKNKKLVKTFYKYVPEL